MKRPIITCRCCKGTGKEPLPVVLWDALCTLDKKGPATATELMPYFRADEIKTTALNNRLEALRQLGLVDRTKRGREWVYFVKKGGAS